MQEIRYDGRYRTLLTVCQTQSYAAAAKRLSLSPSAVAHQIHTLEQELGLALFTKTGKLLPTRECRVVAEYAGRMEALLEQMRGELEASRRKLRHLCAGVTPSVENSALSLVLSRYAEQAGGVQITILSETSETLYKLLCARSIDFAVVEGSFPTGDFNAIVLDTDYLVVAAAKENPLAQKGFVTLEELEQQPLILKPEGSGTRRLFEAHLEKSGVSLDRFRVMMEADSTATIKRLVSGGYGVSVLSYRSCQKDVAEGAFCTVPLSDMNMARKIHIFYQPDFGHDELLRDLQRLYYEQLQE